MSGRRTIKGLKGEEKMPKYQDKGPSVARANNSEASQASDTSPAKDISPAKSPDTQKHPSTSLDPEDIIRAIKDLKDDLKGDNESLRQELSHVGQEIKSKLESFTAEMQDLSDRVGEAETRVAQVEEWAAEATEALCSCLEQQKTLQRKLTDLESRSRRNNIRIFGVTEGEEGNSMPKFIEKLLRDELPLPQDLELKIQRAHRSPAFKPKSEAPPRPIIINFQEYTTKEMVLSEAWKRGKIQRSNRILYFDHDYATEVVKKRKEYNGIKKVLKDKGIRFQTPYTYMRIHWSTGPRTYTNAQEVQRELKKRGFSLEEPVSAELPGGAGERLRELLGWQRVANRQEAESAAGRRARERLQEFQRESTDNV